jgi:DNA-directed RNA polymerase subunit RPC12/RpoP
MIGFTCKNCGQKFSVAEINAGKKGKCPKCKSIIVVPDVQTPSSTIQQKDSVYDSDLLDLPENGKNKKETVSQYEAVDAASEEIKRESPAKELENAAECKFPWIIDIFFYPINTSGMIHIVIFSFLPRMLLPLAHFNYWLSPPVFGLGFLVIYIGYFLYCFSEYIYDSAKGNRRVPESKISPNIVLHIEELLSPILNMFICIAACFGPLLAYFIITKRIDFIFWLLVVYGSLFLPMVLLAVVMFDSFWVLNPLFIVGSIFKVFLRYCGLILSLSVSGGLIVLLTATFLQLTIFGYIFGTVCIYMAMVMAHLLGRFYYRYKDRLNWGI